MASEFKRTMKLMWGHNGRFRSACGCWLIFIILFCVLGYLAEWIFYDAAISGHRPKSIPSGYDLGVQSGMVFLFSSLYGNAEMVLSNMGKWLSSSKLGKCVITKGLIVNRLIIFGIMFFPCLISRMWLIHLGYGEYARLELFFVAWGAAYVLSAVTCISKVAYIIVALLYMISILWNKFWSFATWIQFPVTGAVVIFLMCLVGGTVIERMALESTYKRRKYGNKSLIPIQTGGAR